MGYAYSRIKFEIPSFGLVTMGPVSFTRVFEQTKDMTRESIRADLKAQGFELAILDMPAEWWTLIEWQAIWGECHGYGLD